MDEFNKDYSIGLLVLAILEIVGKLAIAIGIVFALYMFLVGSANIGFGGYQPSISVRFFSTFPGIGLAIGGLFTIATAQVSVALINTSKMTFEMLKIAKETRSKMEMKK